jgi:hypothetical protein
MTCQGATWGPCACEAQGVNIVDGGCEVAGSGRPCYCAPDAGHVGDFHCGGICTLDGHAVISVCECPHGQEALYLDGGAFTCGVQPGSSEWTGQWPVGTGV